eukprot:3914096-Rhodomonas_salina.2
MRSKSNTLLKERQQAKTHRNTPRLGTILSALQSHFLGILLGSDGPEHGGCETMQEAMFRSAESTTQAAQEQQAKTTGKDTSQHTHGMTHQTQTAPSWMMSMSG